MIQTVNFYCLAQESIRPLVPGFFRLGKSWGKRGDFGVNCLALLTVKPLSENNRSLVIETSRPPVNFHLIQFQTQLKGMIA
ncbi:MAG: hypothetical protein COV67_11030 [Nitrospinae bacterium CG11_big_fil_rev_8_21_14_0_20_56_8]|nr:MAG: hypothetical protein COV67_11030 [Nitrospinae bacterium CG11_big_fil_rev_8_21_14_0_20_56_8]